MFQLREPCLSHLDRQPRRLLIKWCSHLGSGYRILGGHDILLGQTEVPRIDLLVLQLLEVVASLLNFNFGEAGRRFALRHGEVGLAPNAFRGHLGHPDRKFGVGDVLGPYRWRVTYLCQTDLCPFQHQFRTADVLGPRAYRCLTELDLRDLNVRPRLFQISLGRAYLSVLQIGPLCNEVGLTRGQVEACLVKRRLRRHHRRLGIAHILLRRTRSKAFAGQACTGHGNLRTFDRLHFSCRVVDNLARLTL